MGTPSQKRECTSVPDLPVDFVKLARRLGGKMTTAVHNHDDKLIGRWLTVCAVTIFGMILLGGLPALRSRVSPWSIGVPLWE